jgi:hypothetical protein
MGHCATGPESGNEKRGTGSSRGGSLSRVALQLNRVQVSGRVVLCGDPSGMLPC